jgi:hypothetical protein
MLLGIAALLFFQTSSRRLKVWADLRHELGAVRHDEAGVQFFNGPPRREAAG